MFRLGIGECLCSLDLSVSFPICYGMFSVASTGDKMSEEKRKIKEKLFKLSYFKFLLFSFLS